MSFGISFPLQRDGNSQEQRTISAQAPAFAPADGRKSPDLLHFWTKFSKVVLHWDTDGRIRDWSAFFANSAPFKLAEIYQADPEQWWKMYQSFRQKAENGDSDGLILLSGHLFAAFEQHQKWHLILENDSSVVSRTVRSLTETNLRFVLSEFSDIYQTLRLRFRLALPQNIVLFFSIEADGQVWGLGRDHRSREDKALAAKKGNLVTLLPHLLPRFDQIAEVLYKSQLAILDEFPKDDAGLEQLIAEDGSHQPHLGLMLAFLRLFRIVQGDFNQLTERHFQYFYREVLQFSEKEATPDAAHLTLELAKQVPESHLLPVGTGVKDGKDNNKIEIAFNTTDELVVSRAAVADVRTLLMPLPVSGAGTTPECPPQQSPPSGKTNVPCVHTALSADFAPFGKAGESTQGRMGFIIASDLLRLSEGTRKVTLSLTFVQTPPAFTVFQSLLTAKVTTAEAWLLVTLTATAGTPVNTVDLTFTLLPDAKPLAPLPDAKPNPYGNGKPLLKVLFKFDDKNNPASSPFGDFYTNLKSNPISGMQLKAVVTGVKNQLILKNDEGNINSMPFQPFGTAAAHRFYVGHPDFYGKILTSLKVNLTFDGRVASSELNKIYSLYSDFNFPPSSTPPVPLAPDYDRTKIKVSAKEVYANFADKRNLKTDFSIFIANDETTTVNNLEMLTVNTVLSIDSPDNLIALKIQTDSLGQNPLGHNKYLDVLLRQSNAAQLIVSNGHHSPAFYRRKAAPNNLEKHPASIDFHILFNNVNYEVPHPPEPPYNPTVQDFSVNYDAGEAVTQFLQLLPFDDSSEQATVGQKVTSSAPETAQNAALVPFIGKEGYLYIGLKNAVANSVVSLLFQVSEYTGNADIKLQSIEWSVLNAGNTWQGLQKDIDYNDDTEGLAQPGIIRFSLPAGAVAEGHTVLSPGFVWLRAAVEKDTDAFDRLTAIHAQAVKAVFAPEPSSDLLRLGTPLPEKSLKKLVSELAQINKVEQPYPAFGGAPPESAENFYRRISERLRHKGRGVNIWDYEALVLEAFPQIYKVKCLNHTLGLPGMSDDIDFLNGHVTVVVIPDVRQLPISGRDEPKAGQNLLGDITRFLRERISPFAELKVLNPRYEKLNVEFKVKFRHGKDVQFYKKQLEKELGDFLAPWRTDQAAEIQFGGEMHRSSLIRFVEVRDYVDYVTDFYIKENTAVVFDPNLTRIPARTVRSVLSAGTITANPI